MTYQAKQNRIKEDRPAWYHAVLAELAKLTGHWKQEPCILGIINAETIGEGWDTDAFWSHPAHPNRNTYYKWMSHDETFSEVLANCRTAVRAYRREAALTAIDEAEVIIQEASPQAARKLVKHIEATDDADSIRAINSIVDRADKTTAPKTQDIRINLPSVAEAMDKIYGDENDEQPAEDGH